MRKREELADPNSCLNKARDDERIFVVLDRDADDDDRSAVTFWGLRTVGPLMEKVATQLKARRETKELPISINEQKNDG